MTSKFIYKAIRIKGAFELIIIIYDQQWETENNMVEGRGWASLHNQLASGLTELDKFVLKG